MLVLTRKPNEHIHLTVEPSTEATEIEIVFMDRSANKIRLGFDAHKGVKILRGELVATELAAEPSEPGQTEE